MGMSPRNFSRVFNREVGVAPGRYVEQCRIEVARQWLEESAAPLTEIAERCGFGGSSPGMFAVNQTLQ